LEKRELRELWLHLTENNNPMEEGNIQARCKAMQSDAKRKVAIAIAIATA
jgi:hypothetical protein